MNTQPIRRVATAAQVQIETMAERPRNEAVQHNAIVMTPPFIGAWTRVGPTAMGSPRHHVRSCGSITRLLDSITTLTSRGNRLVFGLWRTRHRYESVECLLVALHRSKRF
jgi:hypothetical protein